MKLIRTIICVAFAVLSTNSIADPILVVDPIPTDPTVATQVSVNVSVTNLVDEYVGAYDLSLTFDSSILSFAGIEFGTALDGPIDSIQGFLPSAGNIDVFEISLGFLFGQDGFTSFSLFDITFDTIGPGTSSLDLGVFAIGDFFGNPLSVGIQNSSVTVVHPTTVPEPGAFALFTIGILGLLWARRRSDNLRA